MKTVHLLAFSLLVASWPLAAQTTPTFDSSGNSMLKGTYYFREVFYLLSGDSVGTLGRAIALYGNVTFSGTGTYTMTPTAFDSNGNGVPQSLQPITGTYSVSASGYGFLSNPLSSGDSIYGLVSQQGIFIGSSTEGGFNDIFVASPLSSPSPTAATFKGTYWISDTDLSSGSPAGAISTLFQLNPDGVSNLGTVNVNGYYGQNGSALLTQTMTRVPYSFANGAGILNFPRTSSLISDPKYLYISPDGNFVFGGSPLSWDMFVGVRIATGTPTLSGLYYQAGIDENVFLSLGYGELDTYFGSLKTNPDATITGHQRVSDLFVSNPYDYTYSDTFAVKSDGTYSTPAMRYVVGANGIRIGSGIGPAFGLNVAIPAPAVTSTSSVFLDPTGVVNAASYAPFTAGIAPGELLSLFGSNLAADSKISDVVPFPTTLAGVQVTMNGIAAPLYYVTPGVISAIVPYGITGAVVQIQVNNNGTLSNTVTNFVAATAPGILTLAQNGQGTGVVLHSDYSSVTPDRPAKIGETVSVFLTGLGAVTPAVADGAVAPIDPYSLASSTIGADIGNVTATVGYAGLAPGLAGLYQVNLTIPTGVSVGTNSLDIFGPDSYTQIATIPVAAASASAVTSPVPLAVQPMTPPLRRGVPADRVVHARHPDVRKQ